MLRAGELLGVIMIFRDEVRPFTEGQIALMETFADQAAIAIENARLLTELQARTGELTRSVQELQALGEVGQALSSTLDLETVLNTIVARANQLAGTDGCSVWEYDERTEDVQLPRHGQPRRGSDRGIPPHPDSPRSRQHGAHGRHPGAGPGARYRRGGRVSRPPPGRPPADGKPGPPRRSAPARGPRHRVAHRQQEDARGVSTGHDRPPQDLRRPVGHGHPERAPLPRDRGQGPAAPGGRPAQVGVPRQHVARAAHAAQRHHRLQRDAAGGRRRPRRRAVHRRPRQDQRGRQAPAGADQRRARPLQDRGRQDGALPRELRRGGAGAGHHRRDPAAGRQERQPPGPRTAPTPSAACTRT